MKRYCGFDFGTSNAVVTLLGEDDVEQRVVADSSELFLPDCGPLAQKRYIGERAALEYVDSGMKGRYIQSLKSVLSDPGFSHTIIYDKRYTPEELVAMIIRSFKERVEQDIGEELEAAVFGRPARFSDVDENDRLAEARLLSAAQRCGFKRIEFMSEPVAAASGFATRIQTDALALVCDLGGGTSDFSLVQFRGPERLKVLSTHGVKIGGDNFDGEIMWNRLVPYFGYGTEYESYGKMLPVPVHIFRTICYWERISFLKTMEYRDELRYIRNGAADKSAIDWLISLIDDDLGFALFREIRTAKHELSNSNSTAIRFFQKVIELKERIRLSDFERFIEDEIEGIQNTVAETLKQAEVGESEVTKLYLTGGSSMVKCVRESLSRRFPKAEVALDSERFNTVSLGLALEARSRGIITAVI